MDYITKFINGMLDKGGLVAVGGVCAYFFKNDHLPSFMGPVSYCMITAGALGVIRYVVMDYEKDKCNELILDLEEVNSALENKHSESEKIKDLAEVIAEKRDLLQGFRQDSVRIGDKAKLKHLQRQPSNFLIRGPDLGEQSKVSRDVCAAVSTSVTEDNFAVSVNEEVSDMTDHARGTKDSDNLTVNVDSENRDENEINLARSDASTGSHDSVESKELEEEAERLLSEMETRLQVIAKPRGRNVAKFYESIALRLFERVEEQNQRKLIDEQEHAKNLKERMLTKKETVEKYEKKKQPILEATAGTDAISKSEKHEIKHNVREEKPRERKVSPGKTSRKENTGAIPEGIALRLLEMEEQKQRKLKAEQVDAKTLKEKILTKQDIVEKYEKKQPRWEATAETGAIRKSEKKHVMKLNVKKEEKKHEMKRETHLFRKEKHRERKESHGKTSRKESTENIHQIDFLSKEDLQEKLEKVHQFHKSLQDIPVIKIDLEEITPEEIAKDYEEKNALLKDLCKELEEEKLNEENKELTEKIKDYGDSKQGDGNSNELLQKNTNIKDVSETIQTEPTESTSSESVKNSEKIVDEKNEMLRDDLKNVKKDEAVEIYLSCDQEEKQQSENQSIESSVRHQVEKDVSCEQGEKQQTEKHSMESFVCHQVERDVSCEQGEKQQTEKHSMESFVCHQVERDLSCEQKEKQLSETYSTESSLRHQVEGLFCEQEEKQQTENKSIESSARHQVEKDLSCEQEEKQTENLSIEPSLLNQEIEKKEEKKE